MSQRLNAGFNAPRFSVGTGDPDGAIPRAAAFASPPSKSSLFRIPGVSFQSRADGVTQPAANHAASVSVVPGFDVHSSVRAVARREPFPSDSVGLGHPVETLADVRRTDARSAQIGGPDSISQCFQVSAYSGEEFRSKRFLRFASSRSCNDALAFSAAVFLVARIASAISSIYSAPQKFAIVLTANSTTRTFAIV